MLLIEKMETLETIREVDIKSSKETVIDRFTEIEKTSKRKSSTPYHSRRKAAFLSLRKK